MWDTDVFLEKVLACKNIWAAQIRSFLKNGTQNWVGREGVDAGRAGMGLINVQMKSSKK